MSDSLRRHGLCLPGSFVHRNFQARVLEWLAVSFSRVSSPPRDQTQVSYLAGDSLLSESPQKPLKMPLHTLIFKTCEYVPLLGKKNFAHVIMFKGLKMGRLSWII